MKITKAMRRAVIQEILRIGAKSRWRAEQSVRERLSTFGTVPPSDRMWEHELKAASHCFNVAHYLELVNKGTLKVC